MTETDGAKLLAAMRRLDRDAFEPFVADLLTAEGWEATVADADDDGVDVRARRDGDPPMTAAARVYPLGADEPVGAPEVRNCAALRDRGDVDRVAAVTTSSFTPEAEDRAADAAVRLVDGADLVELVREHGMERRLRDALDDARRRADRRTGRDDRTVSADDRETLEAFRSLSGEEAERFERVWRPRAVEHATGRRGATVGALAGILLSGLAGGGGPLALVGIVVVAAGLGYGGGWAVAAWRLREMRARVNERGDALRAALRAELERTARRRLGMTGAEVHTESLCRATGSVPGLTVAPEYEAVVVAVGPDSVGVVEGGTVSVEELETRLGIHDRTVDRDAVVRADVDDGRLHLALADGTTHDWPAGATPRRAVVDLRDRIRVRGGSSAR